MEAAGMKADKQSSIEASFVNLRNVVGRLEELADRIADNNEPKPSADKLTEKERRHSLSEYLQRLPELIDAQGKRIDEAINRVESLLY